MKVWRRPDNFSLPNIDGKDFCATSEDFFVIDDLTEFELTSI
jgi:hypothetical protein